MQKYKSNLQDAVGRAISNAQVTVLNIDGSVAELFSDNGVTPLANPLVTNKQGEFQFYAKNGRYSLSIRAPGYTGESDIDVVLMFDPDNYMADNVGPYVDAGDDAVRAYADDKDDAVKAYADGVAFQEAQDAALAAREYAEQLTAGVVGGYGAFQQDGTGAIVRTFQEKQRESVSITDFGAIGDGTNHPVSEWLPPSLTARFINLAHLQLFYPHVTDLSDEIDWAATQAAINFGNESGAQVLAPRGTYLLNKVVQYESTAAGTEVKTRLYGESMFRTIFVVDGTVNSDGAFRFTKNGPLCRVEMRDLQIQAKAGTGDCGTAIYVGAIGSGSELARTVVMDSIYITTRDFLVNQGNIPNPSRFNRGIELVGVPRPFLSKITVRGPKESSNDDSIRYADSSASYLAEAGFRTVDCYDPTLEMCQAHQVRRGWWAESNAPVEGINCRYFAAVNVKIGIDMTRPSGSTAGVEPGLNLQGSHINFRDYGIRINGRKRGRIKDFLFYHQNTDASVGVLNPKDILIESGNDFLITDNTFTFDAGRPRFAIHLMAIGSAGVTDPALVVVNNVFTATMEYAVKCDPATGEPTVGINKFGDNVLRQVWAHGTTYKAPYTANLRSGTYTPTITNTANVSSITAQVTHYERNGTATTVAGRITITPAAANVLTEFTMSVPIAASLSNDLQAAGHITSVHSGVPAVSSGAVYGDGAGALRVSFVPAVATASNYYFTVTYLSGL